MPNIAPLQEIARFYRRLQWTVVALLAGWLLWLLAPVLSPFVFAAILGWLGDPLVDRIERRYTLDEVRYSPNVRMLMPSCRASIWPARVSS